MKSLTNIKKGSRAAWSPYRLALKGLVGCAIVLTGFQSSLQAQEVQSTRPSWYLGIADGANFNFYNVTAQELNSDLTVPSAFHKINGVGLYVAPLIEFHRPDTRLGFILQAGYDNRGGKFKEVMTPCNCPADLNTDLSYIKVNWNEQKGKLKQQFAVLTDNDLMFEEGKKDEMFGKLQITLGKTKEELRKLIEGL